MNKKGFTLVELLAIIVLIGVLALFLVPNALNMFSSNKSELSKIQKDQIEMATKLYLDDYCINSISECYQCPFETEYDEVNKTIVIKGNNSLALNELVESENVCNEITNYINKEIVSNCSGNVKINNNVIDLSNITCNFNKR